MNDKEIKSKAVTSVIWKFLERMGAQVVSFIVSIILARILDPADYSVVSIVIIFFAFANVLISGGFNSALIQKKNAEPEDYSSVLHVSVIISIVIYLLLFIVSPYIAQAYEQPALTTIIRVMALTLPINAVKSIWCAYISATFQFKKFFFSTIGGTCVSAVIGVALAYGGAGAWALVAQQMSNIFIGTAILLFTTKIHITLKISFTRLKGLLQYGWKVFVSSIIGMIYSEIIPIVIGLKYTSADLAFYTKGRSFPTLITTTTTNTFSAVLFPTLSKYQDDKEKLLAGTRLFIRITSFMAFPLMLGFFSLAENFVLVVLTEKWMPAVPYIKIFCIASMFEMVHTGNCETIKAMGRSDIYLIMEIIKKAGYFATIALFLFFTNSPTTLALAFLVCTVIALVVNSIPNRKLLGYKFSHQFADLLPNLLTAIVMSIVVSLVGIMEIDRTLLLVVQVAVGAIIYIATNLLIKNPALYYILKNAKELFFSGASEPAKSE